MPVFNPPAAGGNVTIDANGFIHIGTAVPFKDVIEVLPDGSTQISHIVLDGAGQEKTLVYINLP